MARALQREDPADVDEVVLLLRHRGALGVGADLAQDVLDAALLLLVLALLDEAGVLERSCLVEHEGDAVAVAELVHGAQVRH